MFTNTATNQPTGFLDRMYNKLPEKSTVDKAVQGTTAATVFIIVLAGTVVSMPALGMVITTLLFALTLAYTAKRLIDSEKQREAFVGQGHIDKLAGFSRLSPKIAQIAVGVLALSVIVLALGTMAFTMPSLGIFLLTLMILAAMATIAGRLGKLANEIREATEKERQSQKDTQADGQARKASKEATDATATGASRPLQVYPFAPQPLSAPPPLSAPQPNAPPFFQCPQQLVSPRARSIVTGQPVSTGDGQTEVSAPPSEVPSVHKPGASQTQALRGSLFSWWGRSASQQAAAAAMQRQAQQAQQDWRDETEDWVLEPAAAATQSDAVGWQSGPAVAPGANPFALGNADRF